MAGSSLSNSVRIIMARNSAAMNDRVNGTATLLYFVNAAGISARLPRTVVTVSGEHRGKRAKSVTLETLNPCIKEMQYAVRGPLVDRASEIEKELEKIGKNALSVQEDCGMLTILRLQPRNTREMPTSH